MEIKSCLQKKYCCSTTRTGLVQVQPTDLVRYKSFTHRLQMRKAGFSLVVSSSYEQPYYSSLASVFRKRVVGGQCALHFVKIRRSSGIYGIFPTSTTSQLLRDHAQVHGTGLHQAKSDDLWRTDGSCWVSQTSDIRSVQNYRFYKYNAGQPQLIRAIIALLNERTSPAIIIWVLKAAWPTT